MSRKIIFSLIILFLTLAGFGCNKMTQEEKQEKLIQQETIKQEADKLIKGTNGWIYYVGADQKRHIFPDEGTFDSWFSNWDKNSIPEKSIEELYQMPLGENVYYKPNTLLKVESAPDIYWVTFDGKLYKFEDKETIIALFGQDYQEDVKTIKEYYFTAYKRSADPLTKSDLIPKLPADLTIDENQFFVEAERIHELRRRFMEQRGLINSQKDQEESSQSEEQNDGRIEIDNSSIIEGIEYETF